MSAGDDDASLPNLINPFWMLPVLGVLGLKARDLIGYTFVSRTYRRGASAASRSISRQALRKSSVGFASRTISILLSRR
jgi:hypothetical protein